MQQPRLRSPEITAKKAHLMSTPSLGKSRVYLPSRYQQDVKNQKVGFHDILNQIQTRTHAEIDNGRVEGSPKLRKTFSKLHLAPIQRKLKTSQFKSRPLKREKNDEMNFKEIFLNPREEALEEIKRKSNLEQNLKIINKQYQKLLDIQEKADLNIKSQTQKPIDARNNNEQYREYIKMLESSQAVELSLRQVENSFYDNQISVQPPETQTVSAEQTGTSGASLAPSIPSNFNSYGSLNLKQLLMRARAGINSDDPPKQAHLSFFLGEVYVDKKMFQEALKFYRRFLGFAKAMKDTVGMSVGANRVATSYFNCGQIEKSLMFHNENLKLSNNDNCFTGFYNVGICYRKLKKYNEALEYFESALSWSQEKNDQQSQCLTLGQLGATYQQMQLHREALSMFKKSVQLCDKLKRSDLKMQNLRHILRISSACNLGPNSNTEQIVEQAFGCAQETGDLKMMDIFRCNIGVSRGMRQMIQTLPLEQEITQIEQI